MKQILFFIAILSQFCYNDCNMVADISEIATILRANKYSLTQSRLVVAKTLLANRSITMASLLKEVDGRTDRASVYRTIDLFEKLHIINRIYTGWKYRIELSQQFNHHHHATCEICQKNTVLAHDQKLEDALTHLAESINFDMHAHQLELIGICDSCAKHKAEAHQ